MRKLDKLLGPIVFLIGLIIFWGYCTLYIIKFMIIQFSSGFVVGGILTVVMLILIALYVAFDLVIPALKQIRSDK